MVHYMIGLDLGTTAVKGVALDSQMRVIAKASSTHSMSSPEPGWAVEEVNSIWQGVVKVLKELCVQIQPQQIAGVCLSGPMHSLFPINSKFQPMAPAMTWADNRAADVSKRLRSQLVDNSLLMRVGCPLQHVYYPARLRWWVESKPEIVKGAAFFVSIKDWILYQMTGRLATDFGLASTTGLLDIRSLRWDDEAIKLSGIRPDVLPDLVSPQEKVGGLTNQVSDLTGLPTGLPVIAGTTDGGLANLGSGAILAGQKVITIGTSGAVRKIIDRPWVDPEGRTWCYVMDKDRWFIGGAINNGGLVLQWVREKFYSDVEGDEGYSRLNQDAAKISPGADGVILLPYFTGERSPYWNPDAFGVILGLGLQHQRGHIARAAMEGVAYCIANVWEVLNESSSGEESPIYLTGTIARNETWAEIMANVLGTPLVRNDVADASAVGAALLGNLALGVANSLDEMVISSKDDMLTNFNPANHEFYARAHAKFKQLYEKLEK